ncbi:MAG: hypothetical protein COA52_03485 [Hyphomicrobiales bacterium]|nr:MAG: hypothetical protein COA52_03485 [Hyphomicrobiales bacterium]
MFQTRKRPLQLSGLIGIVLLLILTTPKLRAEELDLPDMIEQSMHGDRVSFSPLDALLLDEINFDGAGFLESLSEAQRLIYEAHIDVGQCHDALRILISKLAPTHPELTEVLQSKAAQHIFWASEAREEFQNLALCFDAQNARFLMHLAQQQNLQLTPIIARPDLGLLEELASVEPAGTKQIRWAQVLVGIAQDQRNAALILAEAIVLDRAFEHSYAVAFALLEHDYRSSHKNWRNLPHRAQGLHRLIQKSLSKNEMQFANDLLNTGLLSEVLYSGDDKIKERLPNRKE